MKYFSEISVFVGLILLGYGLFLFKPWVGLAACGALLFTYGVAADIFEFILKIKREGRE